MRGGCVCCIHSLIALVFVRRHCNGYAHPVRCNQKPPPPHARPLLCLKRNCTEEMGYTLHTGWPLYACSLFLSYRHRRNVRVVVVGGFASVRPIYSPNFTMRGFNGHRMRFISSQHHHHHQWQDSLPACIPPSSPS